MNIVITRYRKKTETIDGSLTIDGLRICDTAENAKTALKAGTYPLNVVKCKQHSRKMPVIWVDGLGMKDEGISLNSQLSTLIHKCEHCKKLAFVTNNTTMPQICHMLKPGNGVYKRTDGSIILGTYLVPGCLTHPKEAFDEFYQRIRKSIERGHNLTITIVEAYPQPRKRELTNYELGTQILNQL